jgi:SAM-dependent methyltransferase
MIGKIAKFDNTLSRAEKLYISIFGIPINGLRIRARRVLPLITDKYKSVMDAGCGPGIFTFEIARKLPKSLVTGIDIDKEQLKINEQISQNIGIKNCIFEYQDICKMEITNRFDLVLAVDNLEHIENDIDALKRFYNALMPDGEIIIHVPGYYRRWLFFEWNINFKVEGHFRPGYTKEEIIEKVEKAGFSINDAYYTYGWLETITNNISYWITGARMKNKMLYAFVFPFLLFISYFGKNSKPKKGAGVLVIAKK